MASPVGRVSQRIRREIHGGKYPVGGRLPDERTLAGLFSVSRGSIRQALAHLEAERMIVRQHGRGTFVSSAAHAAPAGDTALIGALVNEREYYFEAVIQGAASYAVGRGYSVATGANTTEQEEAGHINGLLRNHALGVLMSPPTSRSTTGYDRLVKRGVPVVLLDTFLPDRREDYAGVDNAQGTALAVAHLVELGHRAIGYLGHDRPGDVPCQRERRRGYLDACHQAGLSTPKKWIIESGLDPCRDRLARLLGSQDRPAALVTYNDHYAIAAIQAARRLGLAVPKELSVVGFDDSALASGYDVPLTSVCPEQRETGAVAARLLIERIEAPGERPKRGILIEPRLIVRQSTGPARRTRRKTPPVRRG